MKRCNQNCLFRIMFNSKPGRFYPKKKKKSLTSPDLDPALNQTDLPSHKQCHYYVIIYKLIKLFTNSFLYNQFYWL